eukprot:g809.t1
MEVTEQDLKKLYTWIDDIPLSRPKKNFGRDFSDGVLMAEVLHYYFPKLVQMHNYTSANGLRQKKYNWETLNRKVLSRVGVEMSDEEIEDIVNCKPRAIESLLKLTRVQILKYHARTQENSARVTTPECSEFIFYEEHEDANNRHDIGSFGKNRKEKSTEPSMRSKCISQIPRAPTPLSNTPPPTDERRPKSSLETSSSVEKDLMMKELQETNELLLAKISKLEELIRLKDKKIDSLSTRMQSPINLSRSLTPP